MKHHRDERIRTSSANGIGRSIGTLVAALVIMVGAQSARAQNAPTGVELLQNGSFENPVVPNGNSFLTTLPSWTIVADTPKADGTGSVNLVRPFIGYGNGPSAPPTGGGEQYLDITDSGGIVRQEFDVPEKGTIEYAASFSQRDMPQVIDRSYVRIWGPNGTIVSETHVVFDGNDPLETWKRAVGPTIDVVKGRYVIEIMLGDPVNTDFATVIFHATGTKPLIVRKTVVTAADPVNRRINPKAIPGAQITYSLEVVNDGDADIDADTQILDDATPGNMSFYIGDAFKITFDPRQSGMTLRYSRTDPTDDVDFSSNGGATWNHVPGNGITDPAITNVRFRPKGIMKAKTSYRISMSYSLR